MEKKRRNVFSSILLFFSALVIVLSLLAAARTAELRDKSEKLSTEIHEIKRENILLKSRCDNEVSLDYLERYATNVLGMQHISPNQIFYLETDEDVVIG